MLHIGLGLTANVPIISRVEVRFLFIFTKYLMAAAGMILEFSIDVMINISR